MPAVVILVLSIATQVTAAVLVLRLIPLTRRRAAWGLIAGAIGLMAIRRVIALWYLFGHGTDPGDNLNEIIALGISVLLLLGIWQIMPVLKRVQSVATEKAAEAEQSNRVMMEGQLRESEQRFREMAENSDEVFWMMDGRAMRMIYVSPAYERVFGRKCQVLLQRVEDWIDAVHPEERERARAAFCAGSATGQLDLEYRILRPDGEVRWVQNRGFALRDETGDIVRIAGTARDVTTRKRNEESLREGHALLATVIESTGDAIFLKDNDGRYRVVNSAFARSMGRTVDELVGRFDRDIADDESLARIVETDRRVQKEGRSETFEIALVLSGRAQDLQVTLAPWLDAEGRPIGVSGVMRDISELKRAAMKLQQAERLAVTGTMAAGIAHEVNNPLQVILSAAQSGELKCDQPGCPPAFRKYFNDIAEHARRCGKITKSLLLFARAERTEQWPCRPQVIMARAMERVAAYAGEQSSAVRMDCEEGVRQVLGNQTELEHVFTNLLRNGLEAGGSGRDVVFRCRSQANRVVWEVIDQGPGLTDEVRAHLFEPFYTTRRGKGGMGLGLSVVHGIVTIHGGRIDMESRFGTGTTMRVDLPAVSGAEERATHGDCVDCG